LRRPVPRTAADVLSEHVTLEVESIVRMYLNLYVPQLQRELGVVGFFKGHRGMPFASGALMAPITDAFVASIHRFVDRHGLDLVRFAPGQRKDDIAQQYLARFDAEEGILFVGVAQEKTWVWGTRKRRNPETGATYPWLVPVPTVDPAVGVLSYPGARPAPGRAGVLRRCHPAQPGPGPPGPGRADLRPQGAHPRQAAYPGPVPHPRHHRGGHPVAARGLQTFEDQAVSQARRRVAHRDHHQRHLRLRHRTWTAQPRRAAAGRLRRQPTSPRRPTNQPRPVHRNRTP